MIKRNALTVSNTKDTNGTKPKMRNSSAVIPKVTNIEYTVSIYVMIIPKIINIQGASLIFGQRKIAKKAAIAPSISWLIIKITCPVSIFSLSS